jgi:hypothetical protein
MPATMPYERFDTGKVSHELAAAPAGAPGLALMLM